MKEQSEQTPQPLARAPIHIPKLYRKHPAEAYASEAYFFIYWWYRLFLWLGISGAALAASGFVGFIVWRDTVFVRGVTIALVVSIVGGLLALMAPLMKPMQGVREPDENEFR